MYLRSTLFFFLSLNAFANTQIQNINDFLDAERFSYKQETNASNEVISGKLILDPLQMYLEIISPFKESYLISKNFITYNDIDFSQQRTFEYSKSDYPIINIISKRRISENDNTMNILSLEDSVYISDKSSKQVFKLSLKNDEILVIEFEDNFGIENIIFLKKLT